MLKIRGAITGGECKVIPQVVSLGGTKLCEYLDSVMELLCVCLCIPERWGSWMD